MAESRTFYVYAAPPEGSTPEEIRTWFSHMAEELAHAKSLDVKALDVEAGTPHDDQAPQVAPTSCPPVMHLFAFASIRCNGKGPDLKKRSVRADPDPSPLRFVSKTKP